MVLGFQMSNESKIDKSRISELVYVHGYGDVLNEMALLNNPTRKAIVYLLATEGPLTLKEIATRLGLSPSTVLDHLRRLRSSGIISEAKDQPKRFKVEVYYKLAIPFFFTSELDELKEKLKPIIDEYSRFTRRIFKEIRNSLERTSLRCIKGKNVNLDLATSSLILSLSSLVFRELMPSSIVYVIIKDKELDENNTST